MNKKLFRLLIPLSAASLIGLVFIQAYWINNALDIKKATFDHNVNKAMSDLVVNLESEAFEETREFRKNIYQKGKSLVKEMDSSKISVNVETSAANQAITIMPADSLAPRQLKPSPGVLLVDSPFKITYIDTITQNSDYISFGDSTNITIDHTTRSEFQSQTESLGKVLQQLAVKGWILDPEKQLDTLKLDSLIRKQLALEGIDLRFVFGMYAPGENKLLFADTAKYRKQLVESGYAYNLYPSFDLKEPVYLLLTFPKENSYLINELSTVLAVSAVLILFLLFSFLYITNQAIKQKKLTEIKNDFINNMTHEFKTPISTISLACQAMNDNDIQKSDELVNTYIKVIDEENKRIGKLAENILQSALLEKAELNLKFIHTDLADILRSVTENFMIKVNQKDGSLRLKLHQNSIPFTGDKEHLYNLFSNLIDNAIKYCPSKPVIDIDVSESNGSVFINVKDNGIGISKSNQKRIFEKLYRVPTGNIHNVKGFGLGLSYVKYICEKHFGSVTVSSDLGQGSIFTVEFPVQPIQINKD